MALITDLGVNAKNFGILFPMIRNKWRMGTISGLTEEENELINMMCVSAEHEYSWDEKSKNMLKIVIEEPLKGNMAQIISKLVQSHEPIDISVANLDGELNVLSTKNYTECHVSNYKYDLNYASSETCKFILVFQVGKVNYL